MEKDKVFFDLQGKDIRARTLELMAQKYQTKFSDDDKEKFSLMESFGVPIQDLKRIIDIPNADRNKEGLQPGIPKDSLDNQLADWIQNARLANIELHDKELQIAIKGDAKEEYPQIKKDDGYFARSKNQ